MLLSVHKSESVYSCRFESSVTHVTFLYDKKNLSKWCRKVGVNLVIYSTCISKAIHLKYDERWTMSSLTLFEKLVYTASLYSMREMMLSKQSLSHRSVWWGRVTLFQKNKYSFYFSWPLVVIRVALVEIFFFFFLVMRNIVKSSAFWKVRQSKIGIEIVKMALWVLCLTVVLWSQLYTKEKRIHSDWDFVGNPQF